MTFSKNFKAQNNLQAILCLMVAEIFGFRQNLWSWRPQRQQQEPQRQPRQQQQKKKGQGRGRSRPVAGAARRPRVGPPAAAIGLNLPDLKKLPNTKFECDESKR